MSRARRVALAALWLSTTLGHAAPAPSARCAHYDPERRPFFGDTHVHTALSFDAAIQGTRTRPRDAYRFARGEPIGVPPYDDAGQPSRTIRLRRPLDFAIVTDHSDLLGETALCDTPGSAASDGLVCTVVRRWPRLAYALVNGHVYSSTRPGRYSFCGVGGRRCLAAAHGPWQEIQAAAAAAQDATSACSFTTFVGYEWTGMPNGANLHRNVVFRNAAVQAAPTTYIETPTAEGLWTALQRECLDRGDGCDVLAIPHNGNASNGLMFTVEDSDGHPLTRDAADRRARMEPLLEITQHKGDSECGVNATDEACGFEKLPYPRLMDSAVASRWGAAPEGSWARDALRRGLLLQTTLGINPFKLGFIGSTDTHFSAAGFVDEDQHLGHGAGLVLARHGIPPYPDQPHFNPGGLAVVWAEENSRERLFAAMRRREAYGTSGPRMIVRVFGGWDLAADLCTRPDLVRTGYARGVPMGGDLPPRAGAGGPTFVISAMRDPGGDGAPSTPLERIQVVKISLASGTAREQVIDVAGAVDPAVSVDPTTCTTHAPLADALCATWRDPDFDPTRPAAYYARVLEQPSCRWSAWVCARAGVRCDAPDTAPGSLAACCDPSIPRTIQERAWTSPIYYTPPAP